MEVVERDFFLARAQEAEARAAAALTPGDKEMWEQIAREYRRYLEPDKNPTKPPGAG